MSADALVAADSASTLSELNRGARCALSMRAGWNKREPSLWPFPGTAFRPCLWRWRDARAALDAAGRLITTAETERRNLLLPESDRGQRLRERAHTGLRLPDDPAWRAGPLAPAQSQRAAPRARGGRGRVHGCRRRAARHVRGRCRADAGMVLARPRQRRRCARLLGRLPRRAPRPPARTDVSRELAGRVPGPGPGGDGKCRGCSTGESTRSALDAGAVSGMGHTADTDEGTRVRASSWVRPRSRPSLCTCSKPPRRCVATRGASARRPIRSSAWSAGCGSTIGGGTKHSTWERGDVFVVPCWHRYRHRADEGAVLFSVSDEPAQRALGFLRVEEG